MGGLSIHLEGYKAIAKADVTLAELTVLAGVNASGKSTLARLFHHTIEVERNWAGQAVTAALVRSEALMPLVAFVDLLDDLGVPKVWFETFRAVFSKPQQKTTIQRLRQLIEEACLFPVFQERLGSDKRILEAYNRSAQTQVTSAKELVDLLNQRLDKAQEEFERYLRHEGDSRPFCVKTQAENWKKAAALHISDGDTTIVDLKRNAPVPEIYSPKRSVYIRQEVDERVSSSVPVIRQEDGKRVLAIGGSVYPLEKERLDAQPPLPSLADGHIEAPPNQDFVNSADWRYVRKDGATFAYGSCAEGIKTLLPLQVLDAYGLLDSNTLLILDEPEVHLHPQWIVDCAEVLVALVKERQVRVLVASHSPYLIQALQRFAAQRLETGQYRFYLAEDAGRGDFTYTYRDLGEDIAPIFRTFNVALDRIAYYDDSTEA